MIPILEQVHMGTWRQSSSEEQLSRRQTCMPWVAPSCICCQVGCPCLPVIVCALILLACFPVYVCALILLACLSVYICALILLACLSSTLESVLLHEHHC